MADIELIIKIPEDVFKRTVFYHEFRDLNDCVTTIKALENGIPIPNNATNGDVMKIIFPKIGVYDEWYDEPYQKGVTE